MYPGIGIACNQNSDCTSNGQAAGGSCCLVGASVSTVAGCNYPKAKNGTQNPVRVDACLRRWRDPGLLGSGRLPHGHDLHGR